MAAGWGRGDAIGTGHHSYGPWQFPEEPIPVYGDGQKMRDWLYVDDHADALLSAGAPHNRLITPVTDRPDHDRRYTVDPTRISTELGRTEPGIRTYR